MLHLRRGPTAALVDILATTKRRHARALVPLVFGLALAGVTHSGLAQLQYAPSVQTDRRAYAAGDEIDISGTGFAPLEAVTLTVTHDDGGAESGAGHESWVATADGAGRFDATWSINAGDAVERPFVVTAVGAASGPSQSAAFARTTVSTDAATYEAGATVTLLGVDVAAIRLVAAEASAPIKLALALARARKP